MGKSLKGHELGVGISQQKDGLYVVRYKPIGSKKRVAKRFKDLKKAKEYASNSIVLQQNNFQDFKIDEVANLWLKEIEKTRKYNTYRNYEKSYRLHVKPFIGNLKLNEVTPLQCNMLFYNQKELSNGTLSGIKSVLKGIFTYSINFGFTTNNPTTTVKCNVSVATDKKSAKFLTKEEQAIFIKTIKNTVYENEFALILNTGLRIGEVIALKWCDIDFKNRTLTVQRTAYKKIGAHTQTNEPKTTKGYRKIPLTDEAVAVLRRQREKTKVTPFENQEYVFLSRNGTLMCVDNYNVWLRKNVQPIIPEIGCHTLRHTFATRCIEGGMQPKTLQKLLGHSKVEITMNLYVHVTDDTKREELRKVENLLKVM